MRRLGLTIAALVFVALIVLNPAALWHLAWASLDGSFGRRTQLASGAGALAASILAFLALAPRAPEPPPARKAPARKRRAKPSAAVTASPPRKRKNAARKA